MNCTKLEALMQYFKRQAGHTTAQLDGVKNTPNAKFIVATAKHGEMTGLSKKQIACVSEIPKNLRGFNGPIVVDHYALEVLIKEHLDRYREIVNDYLIVEAEYYEIQFKIQEFANRIKLRLWRCEKW